MDLTIFRDLLTSKGQEAIHKAMNYAPREKDFLIHFQTLSKDYPREIARGALETAILRGEASTKFPDAKSMYFTREALEQASGFEIARHRAKRYRDHSHIIDMGCSIGGDTLALAAMAPTIGIDHDGLRLEIAKENARVSGLVADFIHTDLLNSFPCIHLSHSIGLFFDPARRVDGRRIFTVEGYHPPLSTVNNWLSNYPAVGVKISPAVKLQEIAAYDAEIEFISLRGELKEAVLWFGPLKTGKRRATVLPGPHTLINDPTRLSKTQAISEPQQYFYEPDPAVIRAGLLSNLMEDLEASQVDPEIAYLTANTLLSTPFARVWQVEDWFPFQLKRLRAYLRERNIGLVIVKKRGSPIQPEALIQALRLSKDATEERVVFLTQLKGRPIVVVCYPEK